MTIRELVLALAESNNLNDEVVVRCEVTSSYKHPILMIERNNAGRTIITVSSEDITDEA